MLTKDEIKQLRLQFWTEFEMYSIQKKKSSRKSNKWIMNNTGIKQMKLKFEFEDKRATVGIDIETRNLDKRIELFSKLESLKENLEKDFKQSLMWELEYILPTGKSISRAYIELKNVSVYHKENWPDVMAFFYKYMLILERFFEKNKDLLKSAASED